MNKRDYPVITLCGSTRFKETFMEVQKQLTLQGYIVISVGLFGHSGDDEVWTDGTKEMLDDMHKRKIDMAEAIYVIDVNGYIGTSTKSEIEYAKAHDKAVYYYSTSDFGFEQKLEEKRLKSEMSPRWIKLGQRVYGTGRSCTHYCSNCGKHGFGDEKYCPECGKQMTNLGDSECIPKEELEG